MKVLSLNIWGGRAGKENILNFFRAHKDVDVVCLQEVWSAPYEHMEGTKAGGTPIENKVAMTNGLQDISEVFSEHQVFFRPLFLENYGILMLISKEYEIVEEGEEYVYMHKGWYLEEEPGDHARLLQYVTFKRNGALVTVMNFHGLWTTKPEGRGKRDISERIEQSKKIAAFAEKFDHPVILAGDFNLLPDSESVHIIENAGFQNLITDYGIHSTRTELYKKEGTLFADYIFTKGVEVKNFEVLPDVVSDHAPLLLECD